jgi:hypothetical protein
LDGVAWVQVKWVTPACCSITDEQAAGHGDACDDISDKRKQEILKAYQVSGPVQLPAMVYFVMAVLKAS